MLRYSDGIFGDIGVDTDIGQYVCKNRNRITHNLTCDSNNDCGDWSDEVHCKGMILMIK